MLHDIIVFSFIQNESEYSVLHHSHNRSGPQKATEVREAAASRTPDIVRKLLAYTHCYNHAYTYNLFSAFQCTLSLGSSSQLKSLGRGHMYYPLYHDHYN